MDGEPQIESPCRTRICGLSWMNWFYDTSFAGLGLLATATTTSRIDVMPSLWPLLEGRVVTQPRPWFAVLVRTEQGCECGRPYALQFFGPLRARVFCRFLLPWLRDDATLSESEHLYR